MNRDLGLIHFSPTFFLSGLDLGADTLAKARVVVAVVKVAIQRADHDPGTGN